MILRKEYLKYFQLLRGKKEFRNFNEQELLTLEKTAVIKQYDKGQILFDQGDQRSKFYFLLEGIVRTERFDENGEFNYYEYVNQMHAFPYRGLFSDSDYSYTVHAMTSVIIAAFPMTVFENLLKENSSMMQLVIEEMGQIINENENQLQTMVASSASDRVRHALSILGEKLGEVDANGKLHISYPLTLIEIAQISATTRETASAVINELQDQHILEYAHKRITFLK